MTVKTNPGLTRSFESVKGVEQGCLVNFRNICDDVEFDLEHYIQNLDLPYFLGECLPAMLYADDLVLVSSNSKGPLRPTECIARTCKQVAAHC